MRFFFQNSSCPSCNPTNRLFVQPTGTCKANRPGHWKHMDQHRNVMKCHCNVSNIFLLLTLSTLNAHAVHKAKKSSRDFERKKKTEPFAKQMRHVASLTHCGNKIVLRCTGHIWSTGENVCSHMWTHSITASITVVISAPRIARVGGMQRKEFRPMPPWRLIGCSWDLRSILY